MVRDVTKIAWNGLNIFLNLMKALEKSFNEEGSEGYILEFDIWYVKGLHNLANDFPFLPKIMEIKIFKNL